MFRHDSAMKKSDDFNKKVAAGTKPRKMLITHKWWVWVLAVFVFLAGVGTAFGSDDDSSDNSAQTSKKSETKKKPAQSSSKPAKKTTQSSSSSKKTPKKTTKKPKVSDADKEAAALMLLKKSYKGKAKVWFDAENKAFMIQPTGKDFKDELLDVVATQDR